MSAAHRDRFQVFALVAGRNLEALAEQIARIRARSRRRRRTKDLPSLRAALKCAGIPSSGTAGRRAALRRGLPPLRRADFVMSAIVGVAGMEATYEAIRRGKRIGLANKEILVAGGTPGDGRRRRNPASI